MFTETAGCAHYRIYQYSHNALWHKDGLKFWFFQEKWTLIKKYIIICTKMRILRLRLIYWCSRVLSKRLQKISIVRKGSCGIFVQLRNLWHHITQHLKWQNHSAFTNLGAEPPVQTCLYFLQSQVPGWKKPHGFPHSQRSQNIRNMKAVWKPQLDVERDLDLNINTES